MIQDNMPATQKREIIQTNIKMIDSINDPQKKFSKASECQEAIIKACGDTNVLQKNDCLALVKSLYSSTAPLVYDDAYRLKNSLNSFCAKTTAWLDTWMIEHPRQSTSPTKKT